jgi:hypothetical protein
VQILDSQKLAGSAFRTLGLCASASQAQIDQAARRMRVWPNPASIPPTDWDFHWLGPMRRTRIDIEQALATLNDPVTRIEERLLWFNDGNPQLWTSGNIKQVNKAICALPTTHSPALSHDIALARLQFALLEDPGFRDSDRWGGVLAKLGALAESEPYLAYSLAAEEQGRFEKTARSDEIEAALRSLPHRVALSIAARAESAMEADDLVTATRILSILRLGVPEVLAECEGRMAERLENLILRRCDHVHEDIDKVGAPKSAVKRDKSLCAAQSKFYANSIEPLVRQLHQVAGPESDRFFRARTEAARAKAHVAQGWAILREFKTAQRMLISALELGTGTPVERPIRDNLERCRRVLKRLPAGPPNTSAPSVKSGQLYIPTYTPRTRQATSGKGKGWAVLIGVLVAVGRLASFSSSPSSLSRDLQTPNVVPLQSPYAVPSIPDPVDAPQLCINEGTPRLAAYVRRDGFGAHLYSLDLTSDPGDGQTRQYAVVGQEFSFKVVKQPLRDDQYHLITGPVGVAFNPFSDIGTWVPQEDQVGRTDIELRQGEEGSVGGPHLLLKIPCYRFDAPTNVTATTGEASADGPGSNPVRQTKVSWTEPAGANTLAGYLINVVNVDRSEVHNYIADAGASSILLPNLPSGLYQVSIAAHDARNVPGLQATVQFEVSPQGGAR